MVLTVGIKSLVVWATCLLAAEAIRADGLNLVGWVANRINPGTEHYADIIAMLEDKLGAAKTGWNPLRAKSQV